MLRTDSARRWLFTSRSPSSLTNIQNVDSDCNFIIQFDLLSPSMSVVEWKSCVCLTYKQISLGWIYLFMGWPLCVRWQHPSCAASFAVALAASTCSWECHLFMGMLPVHGSADRLSRNTDLTVSVLVQADRFGNDGWCHSRCRAWRLQLVSCIGLSTGWSCWLFQQYRSVLFSCRMSVESCACILKPRVHLSVTPKARC
jgi:hypothetical protein